MIPNLVRQAVFEMLGKEEQQEDPATHLSDKHLSLLSPSVQSPKTLLKETTDIRVVHPSSCPLVNPKNVDGEEDLDIDDLSPVESPKNCDEKTPIEGKRMKNLVMNQ